MLVCVPAQYTQNPSNGSATQIIREAPEVTVVPDTGERFLFRNTNRSGDRNGIHQKEYAGCHAKPNWIGVTWHTRHLRMIDVIRHGDRNGHRRSVEDYLERLGSRPGFPQTLDQTPST